MYSVIEMYKQRDIILKEAAETGVLVDAVSASRLFEEFFFPEEKYWASPMIVIPEGRYIMRLVKVGEDQEFIPVYDPLTEKTENRRVMARIADLSDNNHVIFITCKRDFRYFYHCAKNADGIYTEIDVYRDI